ncbi:MAG: nitrilase [Epsilonproteobacteria bacterium]|nr:nitrilase [Campylobacterota bacterium]
MKIEIYQTSPKLNKSNLAQIAKTISTSDADLVLFPELSLNGYKIKDALFENSFTLEELDVLKELSSTKDICIGAALKEGHKIYNASIYFSQNQSIVYKKQHLPTYGVFEEARFFFSGSESSVFDTRFGKTSMFICEDMFSGDVLNFIATQKPDLILVLANSPAREFRDDDLLIQDNWYSILKTSSILSGGYTLFANRVGFEDGLGFWGGSCVITPKGEIEKQAKLFEIDSISTQLDKKLSLTQKYYLRKE